MAEREGFEPSVGVNLHTLSRRAPSAAQTPLQISAQGYRSLILDAIGTRFWAYYFSWLASIALETRALIFLNFS